MALPNYLSKIKSSGIYRYVFDKSEIPASERSSIRLVVGYSEKGPFNTPVYFEDPNDFTATFGNISRRMERKGVYFHRLALQALSAGPILALNLKPFKTETTSVFDFNAADIAANSDRVEIKQAPIFNQADIAGSVYDANRFWKVNDNINDIKATGASSDDSKKKYMRIVQTGSKEDSVTIFARPYVPTNWDIKISEWYSNEVNEEMPSYMEAIADQSLNKFFMEIFVFKGKFTEDLFKDGGTLGVTREDGVDEEGNPKTKWMAFGKVENGEVSTVDDYKNIYGEDADALTALSNVSTSNFLGRYQGIVFPSFKDANGSFISIDTIFNSDSAYHKCLMSLDENVLDDIYYADADGNSKIDGDEELPGWIEGLEKNVDYTSLLTIGDTYDPNTNTVKGYYLEGYNYETVTRNLAGEAMQKAIFEVLKYKGIREALTNNVDVDYKYWIDTFEAYPTAGLRTNISEILSKKFNCLGILNFPTITSIIKRAQTYIVKSPSKGGYDLAAVIKNANLTLPTESEGASFIAFYTQLKWTDGANQFYIPSTALVSNLFMQKRATGQPYDVVAGVNKGRINYTGLVGPDYNYAREDLDVLEPFGVNAIIYTPRYGVHINSNQTAKQTPVSSLSKVHVRELVTYLQDSIQEMLYNYQWQFNDATLRNDVKTKADTILGVIKCNRGIYAFNTVCDESNNPDEVVDNEMVIIDIEIEPARAAGKMVQTLTLRRTGAIGK